MQNNLRIGYSVEELVIAWQNFVGMCLWLLFIRVTQNLGNDTPFEVIESVLSQLYTNLITNPRNMELPVWCGPIHKFQPRGQVLYNDDKEFAKKFNPEDLKLLWIPPNFTSGEKLAQILRVPTLSSNVVEKVKHGAPEALPPIFSRIVRNNLCCWHFSNHESSWAEQYPYPQHYNQPSTKQQSISLTKLPNRPPTKIQKILQIDLNEKCVRNLTLVKCVQVGGKCVESKESEVCMPIPI